MGLSILRLVLVLLAGSAVLRPQDGSVPLVDRHTFDVEVRRSGPAILLIRSATGSDEPADALVFVDDQRVGAVSDFRTGPRTHCVWWPCAQRAEGLGGHRVRFERIRGLLQVGPIEVLSAGRVRVETIDEHTRLPVAAWIRIAAVDGLDSPAFGRRISEGRCEDVVFAPLGSSGLLLPIERRTSLVVARSPLDAVVRRTLRPTGSTTQTVRIELPKSQMPPGSYFLAPGLAREDDPFDAIERRMIDGLFGSTHRLLNLSQWSPVDVDADRDGFVRAVVSAPTPLVVGDAPDRVFPAHPRALRTLVRPGAGTLHTNGPFVGVEDLERFTATPLRVTGRLRIRCVEPLESCFAEFLTKSGSVLRLDVASDAVLPFAVDVERGERLVVRFQGELFAADPLAPRPFAVLSLNIP